MATIQEISPAPWRLRLLPASFSGVPYHVEHQARSSGRRIVMHEYPKRNTPYAEDMGKHAIRYQVTGYLIGPSYHLAKLALITVLENTTGGLLVDPYLVTPMMAVCERYSVTEVRERGGYCTFDMMFAEAGNPGNSLAQADTGSAANASADASSDAAASSADSAASTASSGGFDEAGFEGGFDVPADSGGVSGDGGGGGW
jgi:prophage DNA circulation protein